MKNKSKNKQPKKQHELVGRRVWEINPVQKALPNKKAYNRKKLKKISVKDY